MSMPPAVAVVCDARELCPEQELNCASVSMPPLFSPKKTQQIPKADGFERRQKLYKLYHYLNQLNLFGDPKVRETVEGLTSEILSDLQG